MPKPYPKEFRDDVVRVARNRDDGVTIEQVATDFGVHPMTLSKWVRQSDIDDGAIPGNSTSESRELRSARRRIKLLEYGLMAATAEPVAEAGERCGPRLRSRGGRVFAAGSSNWKRLCRWTVTTAGEMSWNR